jgi:hypothetical protein
MHKLREITQREALSKVTFENALEFFASQGIKEPADREALAPSAAAIENALRYLKP